MDGGLEWEHQVGRGEQRDERGIQERQFKLRTMRDHIEN